jgi:hypothetical protein
MAMRACLWRLSKAQTAPCKTSTLRLTSERSHHNKTLCPRTDGGAAAAGRISVGQASSAPGLIAASSPSTKPTVRERRSGPHRLATRVAASSAEGGSPTGSAAAAAPPPSLAASLRGSKRVAVRATSSQSRSGRGLTKHPRFAGLAGAGGASLRRDSAIAAAARRGAARSRALAVASLQLHPRNRFAGSMGNAMHTSVSASLTERAHRSRAGRNTSFRVVSGTCLLAAHHGQITGHHFRTAHPTLHLPVARRLPSRQAVRHSFSAP